MGKEVALLFGLAVAGIGLYAYWKFAEKEPYLAGLALGAGGVMIGPAALDWAAAKRKELRPGELAE